MSNPDKTPSKYEVTIFKTISSNAARSKTTKGNMVHT